MALGDCIREALEAGIINDRQAEGLKKIAAGEMDERKAVESFVKSAFEQRRRAMLKARAMKRNLAEIKAHPKGVGRGVLALLVKDVDGKIPTSNVDYRRNAIVADLYSRFSEAMDRYRTKNLGFSQDHRGIRNMVRELFGESSGDSDAREFAKLWAETAETARMRANVAGHAIPIRKDWGLPHFHESKQIANVPFEEWRDFIVPRLDRRRIFNQNGFVMGDQEFDGLIRALYDQFQADAKVVARDAPRGVPRKVDHRILTFKNAQGWLEYNDRFGQPDIYHALMMHLEHMAGDIALMEILGPDPDAAMRFFMKLSQDAGTGFATTQMIQNSYEVVTGRINQSSSEMLANVGTAVRNLLSSAQLGSAFVSSFTDVWTARMVANMNGLPAMKMLGTWLRQMSPTNAADREFAVQLGLGAEGWISRALAASRFQEITGHGLSARISDSVFRATLLSPWTQAGRNAFGMEFLGFTARNAGKGFDELPELLKNGFQRYGITPAHWEVIRRAPMIEREGARYLRPADVLDVSREEVRKLAHVMREAGESIEAEEALQQMPSPLGRRPAAAARRLQQAGREAEKLTAEIAFIQDAANRFHEMVLTEMDSAIVMPDARIRAIVTQGQKRGSIMGEVARSVALYKQFPISVISNLLMRQARGLTGLKSARWLAELMLGLTVMGAIAHQTKNVIKGRDTQKMDNPEFWGQAFAQGGGAGIFGDFILSDVSRFGKGFTSTLAGPVFGLVDDVVNLTAGNLHQVLRGQEARFGPEAVNFLKRYTPGSNAWYARLALERLMWDQLQKAADPKANSSFRRIMSKTRREYDQEYWWKPGRTTPERAPEVIPE